MEGETLGSCHEGMSPYLKGDTPGTPLFNCV